MINIIPLSTSRQEEIALLLPSTLHTIPLKKGNVMGDNKRVNTAERTSFKLGLIEAGSAIEDETAHLTICGCDVVNRIQLDHLRYGCIHRS